MASQVETDQFDSCAMSLVAKLMLGKLDRPFAGKRVASFSLRIVLSTASISSSGCSPISSSFVFVSHLE